MINNATTKIPLMQISSENCCAKKQTAEKMQPSIEQKDPGPQYLKIGEKVSFDFASEASYVYILSGQKYIKIQKNGQFWRVFENQSLRKTV